MTQEQKDLLLKDLCARLPYRVKIYAEDFPKETLAGVVDGDIILHCDKYNYTYDTPWDIKDIKPYLFPLSSMTEGQKKEYDSIIYHNVELHWERYYDVIDVDWYEELHDFYNKNHLDYRGLISMGLAEDATGLNIY